jgi:hypothetical protein
MILAWATFITAIATLGALCAAVGQLYLLRKQRRRDFEDLFVQRYWGIMDRLTIEAIECKPPKDRKVLPEDRRAVVSYLRLCEDELDLRAQNWVSADTWRIWHAGIASQLKRWPFDVVWKEVSAREAESGQLGQFAQLRKAGDALYQAGFDVAVKRRFASAIFGGR